ncbi:unnamed protein product, partial [Musa acuminata var. zebrina]
RGVSCGRGGACTGMTLPLRQKLEASSKHLAASGKKIEAGNHSSLSPSPLSSMNLPTANSDKSQKDKNVMRTKGLMLILHNDILCDALVSQFARLVY